MKKTVLTNNYSEDLNKIMKTPTGKKIKVTKCSYLVMNNIK